MSDASERTPLEHRASDRRGFFREGLASLLGPLADLLDAKLTAIREAASAAGEGPVLRPPGALPEAEFLSTCKSCGTCVASCPVQAIYLAPGPQGLGDATPVIDPASQPCVACKPLSCMAACPTGALRPTPLGEIDMGLAVVDRSACLRAGGQDCTACIDRCPIGAEAIALAAGEPAGGGRSDVLVQPGGCIGCGVCEYYCPARPRAIAVQPHR